MSWVHPLVALPACAPTPSNRSRVHSQRLRRAAFGSSVPPDDIVFRPRGFSPPRRLAPRGGYRFVAPCCRSWGSPRFPVRVPEAPEGAPASRPVPRDAVRTLRRVPLTSSRTASLRPLPSCRWSSTSSPESWLRHEVGTGLRLHTEVCRCVHLHTEARWCVLRLTDRSRSGGLSPPKRRQRGSD